MRRLVTLVSAFVLAAVFAAAASAKARDPEGTRTGAIGLGVPVRFAALVASALPVVEAVVVLLLAVGAFVSAVAVVGAALALVLLALFTIAIARTLRAGRAPACHCFGTRGAAPIGADTVVRNLALAALAVVVLVG
jgi:uncharacterized membrane protein YphA (DoxX/SURF4 family)